MIYLRYRRPDDDGQRWGWLDGQRVCALAGDPFGEHTRGAAVADLSDVSLLAPCLPSKIVAIGENFAQRASERGAEQLPEVPDIFLKAPSTVIGPGAPIVLPPQSQRVEHEAELAAIIGRRARWVTPKDALGFVLGYACAVDVTARDLEMRDGQPTRAKGFDTFCPLGPHIVTGLDPSDLVIICSVNGQVRQMASARDMLFSVSQLVAFVSSVMTLEPGDVILTGTPAGVGPLEHGDTLEVEIEGIGRLSNPVVRLQ